MSSIDFKNENGRNTLRCILARDEEFIDEFALNMLSGNTPEGLLPAKQRSMNGERMLCYDITSRQSMDTLYTGRSISEEDLCSLFEDIGTTMASLGKYLIGNSGVLLDLKYIFRDIRTGKHYFIYDPTINREENEMWGEFTEQLISLTEHENDTLIERLYGLYDLIMSGNFNVKEAIEQVLTLSSDKNTDGNNNKKNNESIDEDMQGKLNEDIDFSGRSYGEVSEAESRPGDNTYVTQNMQTREIDEDAYETYGGSSLFAKKEQTSMPRDSKKQKGFLSMLFQKKPNKSTKNSRKKKTVDDKSGELYIDEAEIPSTAANLFRQGTFVAEELQDSYSSPVPDSIAIKKYDPYLYGTDLLSASKDGAKSESGGTEFIVSQGADIPRKLYGAGKNKVILPIDRYPFIVGKNKQYCDGVINDSTISGMHMKLTLNKKSVYLTDLNSTNGTFWNGVRLEPNESVEIEPEDEIRLGKLEFVYR